MSRDGGVRSSGAARHGAQVNMVAGAQRLAANAASGTHKMSTMQSSPTTAVPGAGTAQHGVSLAQAFRVWLRVALLSFGGPAGQIAVMHRILVEEKKWVSENRFLHALNY